jgi:NitT/TauT family transport system ATP-binding protein
MGQEVLKDAILASASDEQELRFIVRAVSHTFSNGAQADIRVLNNVSFDVASHEFLSVVGPSGCGKSTLLNIMSGLLMPTEGSVLLDGEALRGISKKIGYVSQMDSLLPWRTVLDNVTFGLEFRNVKKKEARAIAMHLIAESGLSGFENNYPHELSGGMKKRVDIIRVLAIDPEVIIMDEPFAALDVFTRELMQEYILQIWKKTRKAIIFVTHDLTEAITLADRLVLMSARPSTIKAQYNILLPRPRSPLEIRYDTTFIDLHRLIWRDLKVEVERSRSGVHCVE